MFPYTKYYEKYEKCSIYNRFDGINLYSTLFWNINRNISISININKTEHVVYWSWNCFNKRFKFIKSISF